MTDNYHILCDRGLQGGYTDFCGAVYIRSSVLLHDFHTCNYQDLLQLLVLIIITIHMLALPVHTTHARGFYKTSHF